MDLYHERLLDVVELRKELAVLYEKIYANFENRLDRREFINNDERSEIMHLLRNEVDIAHRMAAMAGDKLHRMQNLLH